MEALVTGANQSFSVLQFKNEKAPEGRNVNFRHRGRSKRLYYMFEIQIDIFGMRLLPLPASPANRGGVICYIRGLLFSLLYSLDH